MFFLSKTKSKADKNKLINYILSYNSTHKNIFSKLTINSFLYLYDFLVNVILNSLVILFLFGKLEDLSQLISKSNGST